MNNSGFRSLDQKIIVELTEGLRPHCPQCSEPGLLSAIVPHAISNASGYKIPGSAVAVLCKNCDIDDPAAGSLIIFLTVHEKITEAVINEAAQLISAWAGAARVKPCNAEKLQEEYELWLRGEL